MYIVHNIYMYIIEHVHVNCLNVSNRSFKCKLIRLILVYS